MYVLRRSTTLGKPRHINSEQDEWDLRPWTAGVELEIGKKRFHLSARDSMFIPRNVEHVWTAVSSPSQSPQYLPTCQAKIEEFFHVLALPKFQKPLPTREQAINKSYSEEQIIAMKRLFVVHGMVITGLLTV